MFQSRPLQVSLRNSSCTISGHGFCPKTIKIHRFLAKVAFYREGLHLCTMDATQASLLFSWPPVLIKSLDVIVRGTTVLDGQNWVCAGYARYRGSSLLLVVSLHFKSRLRSENLLDVG